MNDDGDFVFVGLVDRPVSVCLTGEGSADTVPPAITVNSRRHLLSRSSRARRKSRTSNRSARGGSSRASR
jgi:hypothetical protein